MYTCIYAYVHLYCPSHIPIIHLIQIKDYGEGWLDGRDGTFAEMIPREGDFDKANDVIQSIAKGLGNDVDGKNITLVLFIIII